MELILEEKFSNILKKYPDNLSSFQTTSLFNFFDEIIKFNPELSRNVSELFSGEGIYIFLSRYIVSINKTIYSLVETKKNFELQKNDIVRFIDDFSKYYRVKVQWDSRIKTLSSTTIKLFIKKLNINEITDLVGIRFILSTKNQCKLLLKYLKKHGSDYKIQISNIQNYIESPKMNDYQSLHFLMTMNNLTCEIQIRTDEMHQNAEFGKSSHNYYKMLQYINFFEMFKPENIFRNF
jgi:(p)ppGpp synthase/HD superfamily hydrolase